MNKIFLFVFLIFAIGLGAYNVWHLDLSHPFQGDSLVACIGIMASLCAIVVLLILWLSRRIQQKLREK